jgi:hypothetical protein
MKQRVLSVVTAVVLGILASTAVFANEPVQRTNTSTLWFENWGALSNATLTIVDPEDGQTTVFSASGSPKFSLTDIAPVADGVYSYELTAATDEMVTIKNPIDNGRGKAAKNQIPIPFQMTGSFTVSRGVITVDEEIIEE